LVNEYRKGLAREILNRFKSATDSEIANDKN
jgi:hypothetical protein